MNDTKTRIADALAALLDERLSAKASTPEDNPLHNHTLRSLVQGRGLRTVADNRPARNIPDESAWPMEEARREGIAEAREERKNQRKKRSRAAAARKAQIEAVIADDSPIDPDRMAIAWQVITPMLPIVTNIAKSKRAWASRILGSVVDDIPSLVMDEMVKVLAKTDRDLAVLARAASELGEEAERTRKVPGDQKANEYAKTIAEARKWLMGLVNTLVQRVLSDAFRSPDKWESLDMVDTVMAHINGVGDDPYLSHTKADRAPSMLGETMPAPDRFDRTYLTVALAAAITDRGLDALVEVMLNDDYRRTDGSFAWSTYAEQVFLASPDDTASVKWDVVKKATAHLAAPHRAQGDAARMYVRSLFEWLPTFIVDVIRAFDFESTERLEYVDGQVRAIMSCLFDEYRQPSESRPIPTLTFSSVEEAVAVLVADLDAAEVVEERAPKTPKARMVVPATRPIVMLPKPEPKKHFPATPKVRDYEAVNAQATRYHTIVSEHLDSIEAMDPVEHTMRWHLVHEHSWFVPFASEEAMLDSLPHDEIQADHAREITDSLKANAAHVGGNFIV